MPITVLIFREKELAKKPFREKKLINYIRN